MIADSDTKRVVPTRETLLKQKGKVPRNMVRSRNPFLKLPKNTTGTRCAIDTACVSDKLHKEHLKTLEENIEISPARWGFNKPNELRNKRRHIMA